MTVLLNCCRIQWYLPIGVCCLIFLILYWNRVANMSTFYQLSLFFLILWVRQKPSCIEPVLPHPRERLATEKTTWDQQCVKTCLQSEDWDISGYTWRHIMVFAVIYCVINLVSKKLLLLMRQIVIKYLMYPPNKSFCGIQSTSLVLLPRLLGGIPENLRKKEEAENSDFFLSCVKFD